MAFAYEINTKPTFWWQDSSTSTKIGENSYKPYIIGDYTCNWIPHQVGNIQDFSSISLETINKEWQDKVNKVLGDTLNRTTGKDDKFMYKNYYNIIIIDTKGKVLLDAKELANNEEDAKFETDVHRILKVNKLGLDDVTILINNLGRVKLEKAGE